MTTCLESGGKPGGKSQGEKWTQTKFDLANSLELGLHYMDAYSEGQKSRRVFALIHHAAVAGYKPAALALGEIYRLQGGEQQSPWKAVGWWGKSVCRNLLTDSQIELSNALATAEEASAILSCFSTADVKGLLNAIASYYRREDSFNGQHLADRMLKSFAYRAGRTCISILWDLGDLNACYHLALIFLQGKGVVPNRKKGIVLLETAADQGHQKATVVLAACYTCGLFGTGLKKERGLELMSLGLRDLTKAAAAREGTPQQGPGAKAN